MNDPADLHRDNERQQGDAMTEQRVNELRISSAWWVRRERLRLGAERIKKSCASAVALKRVTAYVDLVTQSSLMHNPLVNVIL